ncbi:MAG: CBS domain-containing protein [Prolixibacteraceae bacterium]|nr:CBS domain-containing protein [Prolixibacteraceae bacterium]
MNDTAILFQELIDQKSWKALKQELNNLDPVEIADAIEALSSTDQLILFRILPRETAKETFQYLSHDEQEDIIEGLAKNSSKISELLNDLDPDDRTAFFEELPGQVSQRLVQLLSTKERAIATKLLGYPEDSIGRLMTPEYVALKPFFTVREALDHIRIFGRDSETLNVVYVVDEHWNLLGDIRIKTLILASLDQKITELIEPHSVSLNAYDDQEIAVKIFQDHDRIALPVIDTDGTLLGIVTFDDVMDVVEEEHTEDFQRFGS